MNRIRGVRCAWKNAAQIETWLFNEYTTKDNLNFLCAALSKNYEPTAFYAYIGAHHIYRTIMYPHGIKAELYIHNDPDPMLYNPGELADTRAKAEHGDLNSQLILGAAYLYGCFVEADRAEALKWLHRAHESGHPSADFMLGDAYSQEMDPDADLNKSLSYCRKAADKGYALGYYMMGEQYRLGISVKLDFTKALGYLLAAEALLEDIGDHLADSTQSLKAALDKKAIARAQKLAEQLISKHQQPDYEPMKYMNYFNPKDVDKYWIRWWYSIHDPLIRALYNGVFRADLNWAE